jgi:hypothetical protein
LHDKAHFPIIFYTVNRYPEAKLRIINVFSHEIDSLLKGLPTHLSQYFLDVMFANKFQIVLLLVPQKTKRLSLSCKISYLY